VGKYYKYTLENTEGAINKRTIQRNWQHRVHNTTKNKTKTQHNMCWTPLCANKTCALPQTTGGKDESNIHNVKTLNRTTQKT